jgi:hypothetical protein
VILKPMLPEHTFYNPRHDQKVMTTLIFQWRRGGTKWKLAEPLKHASVVFLA